MRRKVKIDERFSSRVTRISSLGGAGISVI